MSNNQKIQQDKPTPQIRQNEKYFKNSNNNGNTERQQHRKNSNPVSVSNLGIDQHDQVIPQSCLEEYCTHATSLCNSENVPNFITYNQASSAYGENLKMYQQMHKQWQQQLDLQQQVHDAYYEQNYLPSNITPTFYSNVPVQKVHGKNPKKHSGTSKISIAGNNHQEGNFQGNYSYYGGNDQEGSYGGNDGQYQPGLVHSSKYRAQQNLSNEEVSAQTHLSIISNNYEEQLTENSASYVQSQQNYYDCYANASCKQQYEQESNGGDNSSYEYFYYMQKGGDL